MRLTLDMPGQNIFLVNFVTNGRKELIFTDGLGGKNSDFVDGFKFMGGKN